MPADLTPRPSGTTIKETKPTFDPAANDGRGRGYAADARKAALQGQVVPGPSALDSVRRGQHGELLGIDK